MADEDIWEMVARAEAVGLERTCPTCLEPPGQVCRTTGGRLALAPHAARAGSLTTTRLLDYIAANGSIPEGGVA